MLIGTVNSHGLIGVSLSEPHTSGTGLIGVSLSEPHTSGTGLIGVSVSEPHTSGTALQDTCVFMLICLWPYTENFN